jgi:hypothetical protein
LRGFTIVIIGADASAFSRNYTKFGKAVWQISSEKERGHRWSKKQNLHRVPPGIVVFLIIKSAHGGADTP